MPLEKYFGKEEKIDIKKLAVEEPEKKSEIKVSFDPEKEITNEDWERMKENLKNRRGDNWPNFFIRAVEIKLLFPDRTAELRLDDERVLGAMKEGLGKYRQKNKWWQFSEAAMEAKILFPERAAELGLDEQARKEMKKKLDHYKENKSWGEFAEQAMRVKIVFPHKASELGLTEEFWKNQKKRLERPRRNRYLYWGGDFAERAAVMKILFPERVPELGLNKETWEGMEGYLVERRNHGQLANFSKQAINMKILAAEEVKVSDNGLEIIMSKEKPKLGKETPPLPETRKF